LLLLRTDVKYVDAQIQIVKMFFAVQYFVQKDNIVSLQKLHKESAVDHKLVKVVKVSCALPWPVQLDKNLSKDQLLPMDVVQNYPVKLIVKQFFAVQYFVQKEVVLLLQTLKKENAVDHNLVKVVKVSRAKAWLVHLEKNLSKDQLLPMDVVQNYFAKLIVNKFFALQYFVQKSNNVLLHKLRKESAVDYKLVKVVKVSCVQPWLVHLEKHLSKDQFLPMDVVQNYLAKLIVKQFFALQYFVQKNNNVSLQNLKRENAVDYNLVKVVKVSCVQP